jgi:hypothetical protein
MLMAALAAVNLASLTMCVDLIVNRELRVAHWIRAHRHIAILIPIGIAGAHFWFAKWSGVYDRRGSGDTRSMPRGLWWYLGATALFLLATLLAVKLVHA